MLLFGEHEDLEELAIAVDQMPVTGDRQLRSSQNARSAWKFSPAHFSSSSATQCRCVQSAPRRMRR